MSGPFYDPFPKYLQIREIILRRLRLLHPGDRLPTEAEFATEFQVSRVTIRQVLRGLAQDRIIERRPRLGTSLLQVPSLPADNRLSGPIEEFTALEVKTETRLAGHGVIAAPIDVAAALKLAPHASSYEIRRVRMFEGLPLLLLEAYFPVDVGRQVAGRNLRGGLMIPTLREMLDPEIREEYQQIDAISATTEMGDLLKTEKNAPVLCVKRLFVDSSGRPLVFFKTNFRADRYFYTVKLPQRADRSRVLPNSRAGRSTSGPRKRRRTSSNKA